MLESVGDGINAETYAPIAIGHVRADLIARYNKDDAWSGRSDAFTSVSDHIATLIGACVGGARQIDD